MGIQQFLAALTSNFIQVRAERFEPFFDFTNEVAGLIGIDIHIRNEAQ